MEPRRRRLANVETVVTLRIAVVVSAACHTSIRTGHPLSLAEINELVADLEKTSHPSACGHGRPIMLQMSGTERERQFARR